MAIPIAWGFSTMSTVAAIGFLVPCVIVGFIDTFLKAVLLGRGVPIPTSIILIGAIGGMVSLGMMGLFLGAVILGIGYRLFIFRLERLAQDPPHAVRAVAGRAGVHAGQMERRVRIHRRLAHGQAGTVRSTLELSCPQGPVPQTFSPVMSRNWIVGYLAECQHFEDAPPYRLRLLFE